MNEKILIKNPVFLKVEVPNKPLRGIPVDRITFDDCCCMEDPCKECLKQGKEKESE